jgi:hypothetical protein
VRAGIAVAVLGLAAVTLLSIPHAVAMPPMVCNGHAQLCDRPYNQVVYAGSHNAMATSDNHFVGALQDPSITVQLDLGVRALLIDSHYWELPAAADKALDAFDPAFAQAVRGLISTALPPQPGLWFCHVACQLGALPAVPTLAQIGAWLREHPSEVLTIVNEDNTVRPADVVSAVRAAGLLDLVATPPADPNGSWPTLRQMIDSGHRLVIFSESHDGAAPWYRNLYRYAAETPYQHSGPTTVSCSPNRGPATAPVFLMNHWITKQPGSRLDAGILNSRSFILDQVAYCARTRGMRPTIVAVDYVTIGDLFGAVDALNSVSDQ